VAFAGRAKVSIAVAHRIAANRARPQDVPALGASHGNTPFMEIARIAGRLGCS
jgi:hypothetical protein